MSPRIKFTGEATRMNSRISNVPGFGDDVFRLNFPEAIGPTDNRQIHTSIDCSWKELENGDWIQNGRVENMLEYVIEVSVYEDHVDYVQRLTNTSDVTWQQTMAFNCFNNGSAPSVRDHECKRHWIRSEGEFRKLTEIPRVFGPRPALQLYNVEGAPPGKDIPFVNKFQSTPEDVSMEGWMAIRSRDDRYMVATVSKKALYTFQNREYSCIHSAPTFGVLKPGETGNAITRVYFVEASLENWYERMTREFASINPANI